MDGDNLNDNLERAAAILAERHCSEREKRIREQIQTCDELMEILLTSTTNWVHRTAETLQRKIKSLAAECTENLAVANEFAESEYRLILSGSKCSNPEVISDIFDDGEGEHELLDD